MGSKTLSFPDASPLQPARDDILGGVGNGDRVDTSLHPYRVLREGTS